MPKNEESMDSLALTEKQQEVVWLRYGRRATINQIAQWLKISRRAVLARLSNARRRTEDKGVVFPSYQTPMPTQEKLRIYSRSHALGEF